MRFVLKRGHKNANSSNARMLVGIHVAVLHIVRKTRVGETKILDMDILPLCICVEDRMEQSNETPFEKGS